MGRAMEARMRRRRGASIHRCVGVKVLWMHHLFYKRSVSASLDASSVFAAKLFQFDEIFGLVEFYI